MAAVAAVEDEVKGTTAAATAVQHRKSIIFIIINSMPFVSEHQLNGPESGAGVE